MVSRALNGDPRRPDRDMIRSLRQIPNGPSIVHCTHHDKRKVRSFPESGPAVDGLSSWNICVIAGASYNTSAKIEDFLHHPFHGEEKDFRPVRKRIDGIHNDSRISATVISYVCTHCAPSPKCFSNVEIRVNLDDYDFRILESLAHRILVDAVRKADGLGQNARAMRIRIVIIWNISSVVLCLR